MTVYDRDLRNWYRELFLHASPRRSHSALGKRPARGRPLRQLSSERRCAWHLVAKIDAVVGSDTTELWLRGEGGYNQTACHQRHSKRSHVALHVQPGLCPGPRLDRAEPHNGLDRARPRTPQDGSVPEALAARPAAIHQSEGIADLRSRGPECGPLRCYAP